MFWKLNLIFWKFDFDSIWDSWVNPSDPGLSCPDAAMIRYREVLFVVWVALVAIGNGGDGGGENDRGAVAAGGVLRREWSCVIFR